MSPNRISAIHHITAIAASAAENLGFYENVLGLSLVKQTVNFDDPYTYHLYYGDRTGSPGTIMTFFPWENATAGIQGSGMMAAIAFAVPLEALAYWEDRLARHGIAIRQETRFNELLIKFKDPHGLPLELIGTSSVSASAPGEEGSFEAGHRIVGFHSATALLDSLHATRELLVGIMGMDLCGKEGDRYRFKMSDEQAPGHYFDVRVDPQARRARQGTGTVHHIAFRARTDEEQRWWRRQLIQAGFKVTEIIDRKYFRSVYFHEPGGVLFEIATDPPGFAVDEPLGKLGTSLMLPNQFEAMRGKIAKSLPPLRPSEFQQEF